MCDEHQHTDHVHKPRSLARVFSNSFLDKTAIFSRAKPYDTVTYLVSIIFTKMRLKQGKSEAIITFNYATKAIK